MSKPAPLKKEPSVPPRYNIPQDLQVRKIGIQTVLKFPLESPLQKCSWPQISDEIHAEIMRVLETVLKPLGEYKRELGKASKDRWFMKRRKPTESTGTDAITTKQRELQAPEIKNHVVYGINQITRMLESLVHPDVSLSLAPTSSMTTPGHSNIKPKVIFICKQDIQPPHLYAHIPQLCQITQTKLIPLDKGSESILSNWLGVKAVSCLCVHGCDVEGRLITLLQNIEGASIRGGQQASETYQPLQVRVDVGPAKPRKKGPKKQNNAVNEKKKEKQASEGKSSSNGDAQASCSQQNQQGRKRKQQGDAHATPSDEQKGKKVKASHETVNVGQAE